MKKILVPCDFSKPAVNAFRFALDIADRSKGSIKLVNVIEVPILHDTKLMPTLNFEEELLKQLRQKATNQFKKITEKYGRDSVKVSWEVTFGSPSRTLLETIHLEEFDLVVMGSHGASGLREYVIGSNAEKIIRRSPIPVLVTKEYRKRSIKSIVFPNTLDAENQEALIEKVKALQTFFQARLHIVWINTPVDFTSDVITRQRLSQFAKNYGLKNFTLNIFNHPNEEDGIIHFTEFIDGDLIAMGTHGRRGITHLLNGSVAEDVANHTDRPIWTYTLSNESE
jgi:nucleotide-binding universal stress UspA family protein